MLPPSPGNASWCQDIAGFSGAGSVPLQASLPALGLAVGAVPLPQQYAVVIPGWVVGEATRDNRSMLVFSFGDS